MEKSDRDKIYLTLTLSFLVLVDLFIIGGILIKGHANFPELIKHLKT